MSNLKIFALGGLHEVGKNCYIFEKNQDLIIVDCGVKFLNNNYGLASASIPNFTYLQENKNRIKGLFITHGHEDHIGAIPYLLELIPHIPVYGSEFSITLLKGKLRGQENQSKLTIFRDDSIISTAEFRVKFFRVTHSIPGSFGLIVETVKNNCRIIITGDFKFDWTEIGEKTDLVKLVEAGQKGVDLLLSDSTNAEIEGSTPSEKKVIARLKSLITQASGRVIITSFASNVYRLREIIEIAKTYNKKILLLGSSLLKMKQAIIKASLWKIDSSVFLETADAKNISPQRLIIFCTGSQGEESAVLSRLANQIYPDWKILSGDSIILTSSPIMDNRSKIDAILDILFSLGTDIYVNNKEEPIHVSGHASRDDLKFLLNVVNPKNIMPFHGDFRMLKVHGLLAQEMGVPAENVFVCQNGEVIIGEEIEKKMVFTLNGEKVPAEPDYVFNQKVIKGDWWKEIFNLRKKVGQAGIMIIVIFFNKKQTDKKELPYIFTYGFINMQKNRNLVQSWKEKIHNFTNSFRGQELTTEVKNYVENDLLRNLSKEKPVIFPIIENYD